VTALGGDRFRHFAGDFDRSLQRNAYRPRGALYNVTLHVGRTIAQSRAANGLDRSQQHPLQLIPIGTVFLSTS
jgi:hypothetical protein